MKSLCFKCLLDLCSRMVSGILFSRCIFADKNNGRRTALAARCPLSVLLIIPTVLYVSVSPSGTCLACAHPMGARNVASSWLWESCYPLLSALPGNVVQHSITPFVRMHGWHSSLSLRLGVGISHVVQYDVHIVCDILPCQLNSNRNILGQEHSLEQQI